MPDSSRSATTFHEKLLDSLYDGVYFVDSERRITYWNHGAESLTGYCVSDAVGRKCFDNFLEHVDEQGCALCLNGCPLTAAIGDGQRHEAEVYLRHKAGHRVPVSVRVSPLRDAAGLVIGAVEIFTDVTEKKNVERRVGELENLAFCDPLTGLLNRRFMERKVEQAILEHKEFARHYGILMIDIDKFKQVNDTVGHDAGDSVLRTVSKTLVHSLRALDIVGRWGGEEFVVLLPEAETAKLLEIAERCRKLVAESSVTIHDQRLSVTVSIGGTSINRSDSAASAVHRADQLMYRSKTSGRNRISVE